MAEQAWEAICAHPETLQLRVDSYGQTRPEDGSNDPPSASDVAVKEETKVEEAAAETVVKEEETVSPSSAQ